MVDGYTVEEAASVLGVPRERVWELLARGVLSGSTDLGGGMRLRLKADPPPDPLAPPVERPTDAPNSSTELTPFRELLTEFRSLTERYGQALLALGEARGEVAGLRSRVDMLEARVDLRLPSAAVPISSSWAVTPWPTPSERVVQSPAPRQTPSAPPPEQPTPTEHDETDVSSPDHDEGRTSHRRRGRSGRRATESFADALARAEDPSNPELPGAAETAAALAALRHDQPPDARAPEADTAEAEADADASLPRELPSADQVPVAEEVDVRREPEPAARDDLAEAAEEDVPSRADDEPSDHEPAADLSAEPAEPATEPAADLSAEPAAESAEPATEPAADLSAEPAASIEPDLEREPAWDSEHYSAAIEEPGWISADDVAVAPTAWHPPRAEPAPRAESPVQAADELPAEATSVREPATAASGGTPPAESGESEPIESSGSRELDEALAALDALVHPAPPTTETMADRGDAPGSTSHADPMGRTAPAAAPPGPETWGRPTPAPPLAVRSPASRAYRRLKRIFPT